MTKRTHCKSCGVEFTDSNSIWKDPFTRQPNCVECNRKYQREYYHKKYAGNTEHIREGHLRVRFGITAEQYNELLMAQLQGCAVCGLPCSTGRRLTVDHDHESGEIRGLLCNSCNTALGHLQENQWNVERLLEYMKKYGINRDIKSKTE